MDQRTLVSEEIDAGAEFIARFDRSMPVKAAVWLKPVEESDWLLYIASERISGTNIDVGYREVLRITGEMRNPYLDPFRIKLVGADKPLARAVSAIEQRYAGKLPIRYDGLNLGGLSIDGAYLYALPISA